MHNLGDILEVVILDKFEAAGKTLYRIGERNSSFVVDDYAAYRRGLKDAWEAAGKLESEEEDGGLSMSAIEEIFGTQYLGDIFTNVPAHEAVEGILEYEEKQKAKEQIRVGDEVQFCASRCVITVVEDRECGAVFRNGAALKIPTKQAVRRKTGRHFPQIAEVLKQMQEATDEQT